MNNEQDILYQELLLSLLQDGEGSQHGEPTISEDTGEIAEFKTWLAETTPEFTHWRETSQAVPVPDVRTALAGIHTAIDQNLYAESDDLALFFEEDASERELAQLTQQIGSKGKATPATEEKEGKIIAFPRKLLLGIAAAAAILLGVFLMSSGSTPPMQYALADVEDVDTGLANADIMLYTAADDSEATIIWIESDETIDIEGLDFL